MTRKICLISLLLLCLLPAPARGQEAASPAQQPDPQQIILDELHARLARFADQWLATIRRSQTSGPGNCEVTRGANGRYVARYNAVREDAPTCVVRASTFKPGAYIGSILYKVTVFECSGDTPQQAKAGPFEPVSSVTQNEIFSILSKDAAWSAPK